ncbi:hypothetical protein V500_07934 [Pseudogymnoascus sp. VKM F-4518 (FW-2643)]|nr:hypothetical protein V500_07934 [Pseudogymnoascus sp. VKM F-4518 (FW-2643)]
MTSKAEFGAQTEAREVIEAFVEFVRDKIILVTGVGPNGLGAAIGHELAAQAPALLILTGRDSAKVEAIITELATAFPSVKTRVLIFDISSFASINTAASQVLAYPESSIDIIINNAGVMNIPTRTFSTDGFEMHLSVNYLGAFLFTNSIMPKVFASKAASIANIASNGYELSPFRFNDYNFENPTIKTELWRPMPVEVRESIFEMFSMKSQSQGAVTPLITALDPKLPSGA